jgi:hypothetical protein
MFAGIGTFLSATVAMTGLWAFLRSQLARQRYRCWDREWAALVSDDGRADRQP